MRWGWQEGAEIGRHVLVVRIADPGEGTKDADSAKYVCDDAHDEDGIVVVLVVNENEYETEDKPS